MPRARGAPELLSRAHAVTAETPLSELVQVRDQLQARCSYVKGCRRGTADAELMEFRAESARVSKLLATRQGLG